MLSRVETCRFLTLSEEMLTSLYEKHWGKDLPQRFSGPLLRQVLSKLNYTYQRKVMSFATLKGGVGKTFLTLHAAVRLSMRGALVLVIDLDPESCATNSLLTEEQLQHHDRITIFDLLAKKYAVDAAIIPSKYSNLEIIPSSLRVAKSDVFFHNANSLLWIKNLIKDLPYDYIFLELPPSFSELTTSAYLACDTLVIPCTPNIYSLESVDLTIEALKELQAEALFYNDAKEQQYYVLLNMFNAHRSASQDTLHLLRDEYKEHFLPWAIKESADVQNALNAGKTLFELKGSSKELQQCLDDLITYLCPLHKGNEYGEKFSVT